MTAEERFLIETDAAGMLGSLPLDRADKTAEHDTTLRILHRITAGLAGDAQMLSLANRTAEAASVVLARERITAALLLWLEPGNASPPMRFLEDPVTGRIEVAS